MFIEIGRPPEIFHQEILRRSLVVDPHNYQIHCYLTVVLLTPLYSSNILKLDQINSVYRYLEVTDEKSTHIEVTA